MVYTIITTDFMDHNKYIDVRGWTRTSQCGSKYSTMPTNGSLIFEHMHNYQMVITSTMLHSTKTEVCSPNPAEFRKLGDDN